MNEKRNKKNQSPKEEKKSKSSAKKIVLWSVSVLVAIMLLIYFGGAIYFQSHFFPNSFVNEMDCSYLKSEEVADMLSAKNLEYQIEVDDREGNLIGVIKASEIEMAIIDVSTLAQELLEQQNIMEWILAFWRRADREISYAIEFNEQKVAELLNSWDALDSKKAEKPENAYISDYSQVLKGYEIIPETQGTLLDTDKTKEAVINALRLQEEMINLDNTGCYIEAEIKSDNAALVKKLDTLNKWTSTQITYDWNGSKVSLDGDTIHQWIVEEGNQLSLDEEVIAEFIAANAKENDTYGKKRKFTTALGQELTLPSGAYGWKTDRKAEKEALIELIEEGSVSDREPIFSSVAAKKGQSDIGSSYVECDLSNQHLYLYQDGKLILETDFVSGNMSKSGYMTPPGVFGLTYKTRNAVLRGEDYETPVDYWMPFNGNVGMHDASWRATFGGDIFLTRGSHGCINLPPTMAATIYDYVSTGFPVICYYY